MLGIIIYILVYFSIAVAGAIIGQWWIPIFIVYLFGAHILSYGIIKNKVLKSRNWDLNVCCGKTDGGPTCINVDIKKHADIPRLHLVTEEEIYNLPWKDDAFEWVLSSHTLEHVKDPEAFHKELMRVGKNVVYCLPPIWDFMPAFLPPQCSLHRWICLSWRKVHINKMPPLARHPLNVVWEWFFPQVNVTY
jgi:hypothetical protein